MPLYFLAIAFIAWNDSIVVGFLCWNHLIIKVVYILILYLVAKNLIIFENKEDKKNASLSPHFHSSGEHMFQSSFNDPHHG